MEKQYSEELTKRINETEKKKTLMERCDLSDDYMDSPIDGGYSRWELDCAFDMICDPKGWKNELSGVIDEKDMDIVQHAASFVAASPVDFESVGDGKVRVTGPGYYACVGA